MMKKFLTLLLVCAMALGVLAMTATASNTGDIDYRVGYAKVDLNPYWSIWEAAGNQIPQQAVTSGGEAVTSDHIMPLPMGGYGGNAHRLSRPELVDDNGSGLHADGVVYLSNNRYTEAFAKEMLGDGTEAYQAYAANGFGQNDGDGIYGTCVAIQESPGAEPLLYISVDFITMSDVYCGFAKAAIIKALKAEGIQISANRILINATHTHGSVALGEAFTDAATYKQKLYGNDTSISFVGSDLGNILNTYRQFVFTQLADAAVKALTEGADNGAVTMRKGTIDMFDATGYQLNGVRHRTAELTTTVNGTSQKVQYVTGSSFNVDLDGEKEISSVSKSDDRLHVLEFSFRDADVKPILLINWRAHTTWNNKMNSKAYNNLSADFVAPMRWKLESWGYRPILSYGASGNLGTGDTPSTFDIASSATGTVKDYTMPANDYGYTLAFGAAYLVGSDHADVAAWRTNRIAELKNKRGNFWNSSYSTWNPVYQSVSSYKPSMTECAQGPILLQSMAHEVLPQYSSDAEYQAHLYHDALAVAEGGSATNDGGLKLEKTGYPFVVKAGTYTVNDQSFTIDEDVVIASQYHSNALKSHHGTIARKRLSLSAFTLGEKVAFVTCPIEASDRYSMDATLATANDYNDWDNLVDEDTWGTPFVVALVNGADSYMPNNLAYTYDEDLEAKTIAGTIGQAFVSGSYEAQIAYCAAGEGEKVVAALNNLLRGLSVNTPAPTQTKYCQACQKNVQWSVLNNNISEDFGGGLAEGHYYLAEDYTDVYSQLTLNVGNAVCLDLNGHTMYVNLASGSRAFTVYGTLNIQDSVGGGVLQGSGTSASMGGGTILVQGSGVVNLYSGTLTNTKLRTTKDGGIMTVYKGGTFNMYGGTVSGGSATEYGGNLYVQDGSVFNMYGGSIANGTASIGRNFLLSANSSFRYVGGYIDSSAGLSSTHLMGKVLLGHPTYAVNTPETASTVLHIKNNATVTLDGYFTGNVKLNFEKSSKYPTKPVSGDVVGAVKPGAMIDHANGAELSTYYSSSTSYYAVVNGTDLVIGAKPTEVVASVGNTTYTNLVQALRNSTESQPAKLLTDVPRVLLKNTGYLDLNGKAVTWCVTDNGYTLRGLDTVGGGSIPNSDRVEAVSSYVKKVNGDLATFIAKTPVAQINGYKYYDMESALAWGGTESNPIVLLADVTEDIKLSKNQYLNLAGFDLLGTVNSGSFKLYCLDTVGGGSVTNSENVVAVNGYNKEVVEDRAYFSKKPVAMVGNTKYYTMAEAISAYTDPNMPVVLLADADQIVLGKDVCLDLNGHDVAAVDAKDHTLYCMDSATDDFSVADGIYGQLASISGNVEALDGYWEITEADGRSFHRFAMYMDRLTVNTKKVGLKFEAVFQGDELIKGSIREFGVAVRAYHKPDTNSVLLDTSNLTHMALAQSAWQTGAEENTVKSVYVRDIMDPSATADTNNARADVPIYTAAYVKLSDGTMLFSEENTHPYSFTMKTAMAHMNGYWDDLGTTGQDLLANFYNTYKDEMQSWPGISNIRARAEALNTAAPGIDIPVN